MRYDGWEPDNESFSLVIRTAETNLSSQLYHCVQWGKMILNQSFLIYADRYVFQLWIMNASYKYVLKSEHDMNNNSTSFKKDFTPICTATHIKST